MQPYGRREKGVKFHSKTDHRIRFKNRKIGNWWEGIAAISKKSERQKVKQFIRNEVVQNGQTQSK